MNKIDIINIALNRIGAAPIASMEEASQTARVVKSCYDFTRQNLLRKYPWGFATRRNKLAQLEYKPEDYRFSYRYPGEVLYLRKICTPYGKDDVTYKIASDKTGKVIYTDIAEAVIEYTADIQDCTLFDSQFVEALAWKLAAEIAFTITGDIKIAQAAVQAYNAYLAEARGEDAKEDNEHRTIDNRLVDARWTGA